MRLSVLIMIVLLIVIWKGAALNINNTFNLTAAAYVANELEDMSSSSFPGAALLNYILFGSTGSGFYYYQYLLSYGFKVSTIIHGDLIIGNDSTLGGICCEGNVIIPVPGSVVTKVPIMNLPKYFPKGYTILRNNKTMDNIPFDGNIFGTIHDGKYCSPCEVQLKNYKDINIFTQLSIFWLDQVPTNGGLYVDFYGYTKDYNNITKRGTLMATYYQSSTDNSYYPLELNNDNTIRFQMDSYNDLIFSGNILLYFHGFTGFYNFTGVMHQQ